MFVTRHRKQRIATIILTLGLGLLLVACLGSAESQTDGPPEGVRTWLLVRAPETALPVNRPITVRSRTEAGHKVSHVELYAVEMPGATEVLIRADEAPFDQTSFTAEQTFTPIQTGHYVIKVVGYDHFGRTAESNFIGFDVVGAEGE
ncbi:MAG: hypothetical protein R3264_07815 [Anaerolineae bacterium]|nr:hypothetical protein [Anaerolineae bacterium]